MICNYQNLIRTSHPDSVCLCTSISTFKTPLCSIMPLLQVSRVSKVFDGLVGYSIEFDSNIVN